MIFYIGIGKSNQMAWARGRFMLSFQICRGLKKIWSIPDRYDWIMESGSFGEINNNGKFSFTPEDYFKYVELWQPDHFVSMDWMCDPGALGITKKTVKEHQMLSLENQLKLADLLDDSWLNKHTEFMGVIQGWETDQYIEHIDMLKEHDMLLPYMGVGSIVGRTTKEETVKTLQAIRDQIPDVKLHVFGAKTSFLKNPEIYDMLYSADSHAWCMAGWRGSYKEGRRLFLEPCIYHEWKRCNRDTNACTNCGRFMNYWIDQNLKFPNDDS